MQPFSNVSPSEAWTARSRPARERMRGRTLVPAGGRCRTTNTLASRSAGSSCTTARSASTPPAEAPTTTTSCPLDCVAASKPILSPCGYYMIARIFCDRDLRSAAEPLGRAGPALLGLGLTVSRRRRGDQLVEQARGHGGDVVDGTLERLGVGA